MRSQPLAAVWKLGEACQPLRVLGLLRAAVSRAGWNPSRSAQQRQQSSPSSRGGGKAVQGHFPCRPPALSKAFLGAGGTSWAWSGAKMTWETATAVIRGK